MSKIQLLGFAYAAMFFFIASMDYIPGLTDSKGYLFGLFALDLYDNSLHAFSGLWALIASWISHRQAVLYFKIFGTAYLLDGIFGLFLGNGFIDFGIFLYGVADYSLVVRILANLPHIAIGGIAVFIGFYLSKKSSFTTSAPRPV